MNDQERTHQRIDRALSSARAEEMPTTSTKFSQKDTLIASGLPMGSAKILAGFVSKAWPHHAGSMQEWDVLRELRLVRGFQLDHKGEAVAHAALALFDSVSLDPDRYEAGR